MKNNDIQTIYRIKAFLRAGAVLLSLSLGLFTPANSQFLWFGRGRSDEERAASAELAKLRGSSPSERGAAASEVISRMPESGVNEVAQALRNETDPRAKRSMINALGNSRRSEAAGTVREYLDDDDSETRLYAAGALGELGDDSGLSELEQTALNPDELRGRRSFALRSLGGINSPEAVRVLSEIIGNEDPAIRLQAAVSLHRIGTDEALAALETLKDDPDEHIRETVENLLSAEVVGR